MTTQDHHATSGEAPRSRLEEAQAIRNYAHDQGLETHALLDALWLAMQGEMGCQKAAEFMRRNLGSTSVP